MSRIAVKCPNSAFSIRATETSILNLVESNIDVMAGSPRGSMAATGCARRGPSKPQTALLQTLRVMRQQQSSLSVTQTPKQEAVEKA